MYLSRSTVLVHTAISVYQGHLKPGGDPDRPRLGFGKSLFHSPAQPSLKRSEPVGPYPKSDGLAAWDHWKKCVFSLSGVFRLWLPDPLSVADTHILTHSSHASTARRVTVIGSFGNYTEARTHQNCGCLSHYVSPGILNFSSRSGWVMIARKLSLLFSGDGNRGLTD